MIKCNRSCASGISVNIFLKLPTQANSSIKDQESSLSPSILDFKAKIKADECS